MSVEEEKKPRRWRVSKALRIVLVGFILYFFVLPLIPGFRSAVSKLQTIRPDLLVIGIALQGLALFSYTMLTKSALGEEEHKISALRLYRIQLSTKALGNIVPGGSAASSALGFRLITMCGVSGTDAGFALATAGVGSAVVLNFILWFGLIVSIPARGVNAGYGAAAVVGVLFMAFAAFIIFGLVEGQGRSERVVRAVARRLRFDEQHAAEVLSHLGSRIENLVTDRKLLWKVIGYATANWALDAASLYVFLRAFGGNVDIDGLIIAFGIANVFSVIPITPGGLGLVEGIYIPLLVGFGLTRPTATVGVLSYRVAQYWLPIVVGWACYLSLSVGRWAIDKSNRLVSLPEVASAETASGLSNIDWVEKYAPRDRTGQIKMPILPPDFVVLPDENADEEPEPK